MDGHYCQHDYWDYEDVKRVKPDCQVVKAEAEDYLSKVRTQDWSVIRQRLPYVDGQLSSDVKDQVVASVRFNYRHDAENNSGDPENLVSQLVSASEVLVEHVHDSEKDHGVGGLVVNVPDEESPVYLIVYRRYTVERRIACRSWHIRCVSCCRRAVSKDWLEMK